MTRWARAALAAMLAAAAAAALGAEAPPDAWLRASAHLDRAALARGGHFRIAVLLNIDKGYHVNANPPSLAFQIPVTVEPQAAAGVRWGETRYPPAESLTADWSEGKPVAVYAGRAVVTVAGTVAEDAPLGPLLVRLKLSYQGCDADSCYRPASRTLEAATTIVQAGTAVSPANVDVFGGAGPLPAAALPAIRFEGETNLAATFERGLAAYLGALFLGGLLLNLTPCVFPLIPVTMTVFAQQGEHRPLKVLPLALVYVVGLAATFTVVGVAAAMAGRSLGLVLQEPVGVLAVVAVLATMMASTFGAFEIRLPSGLMGRLGARRGLLGAAFMGMVMGAVAAPCVGPFLLALITFVATARSVPLGAVSFFVTGLGLGAPYVLLGTFTGLINRFPHGGGWLVWTKRLMGLALAGLILYYVERFIDAAFYRPLVLGLFICASIYLGFLEGRSRRPFTRRFRAVRIVAAVLLLAAGLAVYGRATAPRPEVKWQSWTPGVLEKAQAAGRPVLLYFGADWCVECKEWKGRIFTHPEVVRLSARLAAVYVDVTQLEEGPKKDFAARFQAVNPPAVILFGRDGRAVAAYRSPPDAATFVDRMQQTIDYLGPGPTPPTGP